MSIIILEYEVYAKKKIEYVNSFLVKKDVRFSILLKYKIILPFHSFIFSFINCVSNRTDNTIFIELRSLQTSLMFGIINVTTYALFLFHFVSHFNG